MFAKYIFNKCYEYYIKAVQNSKSNNIKEFAYYMLCFKTE